MSIKEIGFYSGITAIIVLILFQFDIISLTDKTQKIIETNRESNTVSIEQLKEQGTDVNKLVGMGFSIKQIKKVGYTLEQFKQANFSKDEMLGIGFTQEEINKVYK